MNRNIVLLSLLLNWTVINVISAQNIDVVYRISMSPIFGIERTFFSSKYNKSDFSKNKLGYSGLIGGKLTFTKERSNKNFNSICISFIDSDNVIYTLSTTIDRSGYFEPNYRFERNNVMLLVPITYSRGLKYIEYFPNKNNKYLLAGYPEISLGIGKMFVQTSEYRNIEVFHQYFAEEQLLKNKTQSYFFYFSTGFQFMKNHKERLKIELVWVKGVEKVLEADLYFYELSGNIRHAYVYSRGSIVSLNLSYPIFQLRLNKPKAS